MAKGGELGCRAHLGRLGHDFFPEPLLRYSFIEIECPNLDLSSSENFIDIAHLDDLDDPDGLNPFLVLSAGMRLEGLATSQCIASGSVIAGWHAHLSALASRAGKGVHLRIRAHRNAASVLHRYQRKRLY